jgi:hypothetical protein
MFQPKAKQALSEALRPGLVNYCSSAASSIVPRNELLSRPRIHAGRDEGALAAATTPDTSPEILRPKEGLRRTDHSEYGQLSKKENRCYSIRRHGTPRLDSLIGKSG